MQFFKIKKHVSTLFCIMGCFGLFWTQFKKNDVNRCFVNDLKLMLAFFDHIRDVFSNFI